jgi:hypothetical protein
MAGKAPQTVIIGLKAFSNEGLVLLRQSVAAMGKLLDIQAVSSVYRVSGESERTEHIHDLRSLALFDGMILALMGETRLEPVVLKRELKRLETESKSEALRRSVNIELFFYGRQTLMTPELTLPSPEFHLRPENVLPVVEICPDLVHPVLKRTVRDLGKAFSSRSWGEFVAQGKAMLDFSAADQ